MRAKPSSTAISRGLIEAYVVCRVERRRPSHPRRSALASLKLGQAHQVGAFLRGHPRRSAVASLKHRHFLPALHADRSHPRRSAVASLKRLRRRRTDLLTGHPRRSAVASLKPGLGGLVVADLDVSSTAISRGLIEAMATRAACPTASRSSTAISRGLIEASTSPAGHAATQSHPRRSAVASLKHGLRMRRSVV